MSSGGSDTGPVALYAMVARPRELLRELRDGNDSVKVLKAIKNQVIGSKTRKIAFIGEGAIEQVLKVLKTCSKLNGDKPEAVQQEAAVVLGSLTYGTEAGLRELIAQQGVPHLVKMLHSKDSAVVEAGLRAIKMVVQQANSYPSYLYQVTTVTDTAAAAAAAATADTIELDDDAIAAVVRCLMHAPSEATSQAGSIPAAPAPTSSPAPPSPAAAAALAGGRTGWRSGSLSALAVTVVACCCRRQQERTLAISAGAPSGLLQLLLESERADVQIAALEGLSLMLPHHPPSCALALARPGVYGRLMALLRDPEPAVRLLSASCVATLSRTPDCQQSEAMQRAALPVLLRLLAQPATRPHVPAVLARLIEGSEPLQKAAADADTVQLLAGLLASEAAATPATGAAVIATAAATTPPTAAVAAMAACSGSPSAAAASAASASAAAAAAAATTAVTACSMREGCLRALGSLCLNRDESRKQLLEAKVLRHIVRSLEDPCEGVRAAAALCVRALTRCVRTLRGGLLDGGFELAPVLVGLLGDTNADVQTSAAAALANLVLDFSSVKSAVLAAGGLPCLVALALPPTTTTTTTTTAAPASAAAAVGCSGAARAPGEVASPLRRHATWALANLTYRADGGVRTQLLQALPWHQFHRLLYDTDPEVVEQALVMLRNLSMGDALHVRATMEWAGCGPLLRQHQQGLQRGEGTAASAFSSPGASDDGGNEDIELLGVLQQFIEAAVEAAAARAQQGDEGAKEAGGRGPPARVHSYRVYRLMSLGGRSYDEEEDPGDEEEPQEAAGREEQEDTEMEVIAAPDAGAPAHQDGAQPTSATLAPNTDSDGASAGAASVAAASSGQQSRHRHAPQHALTQGSHTLYAVVNLLTGGPEVKDTLAARRSLMAAVAANLRLETPSELVLPAVWCIINLAWPPAGSGLAGSAPGAAASGGESRAEAVAAAARCRTLVDLGATQRLEQLQRSHPSRDVQERARTALEQLRKAVAAAEADGAA